MAEAASVLAPALDIIAFVEACLDEDEMWAREASRRDDNPIPEGGAHWVWEDNAHPGRYGEEVPIDPGSGPYLLDADEVLLCSREQWPTSAGMLPLIVVSGSEVPVAPAGHIVRHDPARVLAGCVGKRAALAWCREFLQTEWFALGAGDLMVTVAPAYMLAHRVVVALAQEFAGRPGFRPEWVSP